MPPSYKHIIHFSLLTPPHSSKESAGKKNEHISEHFLHKHSSVHLGVRVVLYTHVKKNYLYVLNIWTQNNLSLCNLHVI